MVKFLKIFSVLSASMMISAAASAVEPTPPAATATIDPMQQMICRKDKETGSLVKTKKTCHTRAQWAYIADFNQRFSRDLVDNAQTKPAGN